MSVVCWRRPGQCCFCSLCIPDRSFPEDPLAYGLWLGRLPLSHRLVPISSQVPLILLHLCFCLPLILEVSLQRPSCWRRKAAYCADRATGHTAGPFTRGLPASPSASCAHAKFLPRQAPAGSTGRSKWAASLRRQGAADPQPTYRHSPGPAWPSALILGCGTGQGAKMQTPARMRENPVGSELLCHSDKP